ncbi:hypothetical protein LMED105_05772 [Limnobacter sp. MED105]|nr:hypothetical protein LMED105_05772 [Limnobacter sp. MED105]
MHATAVLCTVQQAGHRSGWKTMVHLVFNFEHSK